MIGIHRLFLVMVLTHWLAGCASAPVPPEPPPQTFNYQEILNILERRVPTVAKRYQGFPYKLGANPDVSRFTDCSNLVSAITRNSLENSPYRFTPYAMVSGEIFTNSTPVSREELRAGDMIIFADPGKHRIDHAGIVVAKNRDQVRFVHTSNIKGVMETSTLDMGWRHYWERRFDSYRRWKPKVFALRSNMLAWAETGRGLD